MKNAEQVMEIGNENNSSPKDLNAKHTRKIKKKNKAKTKFVNWLIGIALSALPLVTWPFYTFLTHKNFGTLFYDVFCDISIIFVGISFTVTTLNDFMERYVKEQKISWILAIIVFLLLGAIIYSVLTFAIKSGDIVDTNLLFGINISYFSIMGVLSASKYIREIKEEK